jgi:hypothetical protein
MMSQLLKRSSMIALAIACVFPLNAVENDAEEALSRAKSNRQRIDSVQVVISPTGQNFGFTINNGTGEILEPATLIMDPLLNGGSSTLTGLIYPADTVDPMQPNFNVDKDGHVLTMQNSIGNFIQEATTLTDINFINASETPFPSAGTSAELVNWFMTFNNNCCSSSVGQTNIAVEGVLQTGNVGSNQVIFFAENMPAIQAGPHASGTNIVTSARVFFSQIAQVTPSPQMLIEIAFENSIKL